MTVKELKEKLNEFDDNLIVMIPNDRLHSNPEAFWCTVATDIYQGVNEADGSVFIQNMDESCETCMYYDTDINDQPCCSCNNGENWERCNKI